MSTNHDGCLLCDYGDLLFLSSFSSTHLHMPRVERERRSARAEASARRVLAISAIVMTYGAFKTRVQFVLTHKNVKDL